MWTKWNISFPVVWVLVADQTNTNQGRLLDIGTTYVLRAEPYSAPQGFLHSYKQNYLMEWSCDNNCSSIMYFITTMW